MAEHFPTQPLGYIPLANDKTKLLSPLDLADRAAQVMLNDEILLS